MVYSNIAGIKGVQITIAKDGIGAYARFYLNGIDYGYIRLTS